MAGGSHAVGVGDVVGHGVGHGWWEGGVVEEHTPGHRRSRGGGRGLMGRVEGMGVVERWPMPVGVGGRGSVGGHGRVRGLGVVGVGQP